MTTKAIITRRGVLSREAAGALESTKAESIGLNTESVLSQGTLVSGDVQKFAQMEAQGYRVKLLPDTNILEVGSYRIDIEAAPPALPSELQVPKSLEKTWPHHLVQLIGPATQEWIQAIEEQGVDVVEPISAYGLFVVGSPEEVNNLKSLPFVAWVGPFQPAYRLHENLSGLEGKIRYVNIGVYPRDELDEVKEALAKVKAVIIRESPPNEGYSGEYSTLITEVDAKYLPKLACLPGVRWLEYASPKPGLDGERETQILAENLNGASGPNTGPVTGYQTWLADLGINGAGVTVAICDMGVDANANNNASGHLDLRGRQVAFVDYSNGKVTTDTDGHGTHVAGIAVGNAASGQTEAAAPNNFLWGQGMAPQANYVTQNALMGPWPPVGDLDSLTRDALNNGSNVQNNSWWDGGPAGSGYTANARKYDQLVRDPNDLTPTLENLIIVFSCGNSGPKPSTITPPKEAKNPITVGASQTYRPGVGSVDDIRGIANFSSRGPALDGRILPNVVAPGVDVSSVWSKTGNKVKHGNPIANTGTPDPANPGSFINQYLYMGGTSMASPHVTGACALLIQWWRNRTNGKNPSQALLKALLINGAEDLAGGPDGAGGTLTHIPNNNQGWGRVSLNNILRQFPASDRGPKIFLDQQHAFTATGQEHMIRVAPVDTKRPMRITLVWTDAPGAPDANPSLVNDLDLEVIEMSTGKIYKGNVFANGFSTTGGSFDNLNNIECVYLQNPGGTYEVSVIASNIAGNARPPFNAVPWQDFSLVIDNAEVPSSVPVSVVPLIDRSGSMVFYGYEKITKISSKQFVDLMGIDDKLGVVSFGSQADVEYPTGASPTLKTITDKSICAAAKTEIEGIAFGGCTYMGDGIIKAGNLLKPATGSRAIVLLSDGYDNKGCDQANPAKPSAIDALAKLPANMRIYTCAMGPSSDQALLEQIANITGGRYYYMPTIDDLFEIYNYIRGHVTGEGVILNQSEIGPIGRVGGFVDSMATKATFTAAWANTNLKFVAREPKGPNEVRIRLRDPRGRRVDTNFSYVRRIEGAGYVIFELQEPMPGEWFVEIKTGADTKERFTIGGFVRSKLQMAVHVRSKQLMTGIPLTIAMQVFDGISPVKDFSVSTRLTSPNLGIASLKDKYSAQMATIQPDPIALNDTLPLQIAKLNTLRVKMLQEKKPDLFAPVVSRVTLKNTTIRKLKNLGLENLVVSGDFMQPLDTATVSAMATLLPTAMSGIFTGQFKNTKEQGSYNIVATATGTSPKSNTRFVRKELVSVLVK